MAESTPFIENNAIIFGLLAAILCVVFSMSNSQNHLMKKVFSIVPALLLCYILPALLTTFNIIPPSGDSLWGVAKHYFLPASLILMTLSVDLKAVFGLGRKALIMFFTATLGIIFGGPFAILIVGLVDPNLIVSEGQGATWRGLATVSGSWIGGGANQAAMLELYGYETKRYATMVAIDIIVANIWMAFLLFGSSRSDKIDRWLRADSTAIDRVKKQIANSQTYEAHSVNTPSIIILLGLAFAGVGISHVVATTVVNLVSEMTQFHGTIFANYFFWIVVTSTSFGLALSFTKFRRLESHGASKFGSVFIYLLVAIIGTKMDLRYLSENLGLVLLGVIWMSFHVVLLFVVAKVIRAPFFFIAVGSKANVGGAASAPVIAAAFHPSLAPVGVLLAVLGYALGTYGAILCAQMMQFVST